MQCFEEDINIPMIIRGPTVAANQSWDLVTGHVDMAPTILQLAGVDFDPAWQLDGTPISFPLMNYFDYLRNLDVRGDSTHLEFWGPVSLYDECGILDHALTVRALFSSSKKGCSTKSTSTTT